MARSKYLRLPQYEVGKYPIDRLEKVQTLFSHVFGSRTDSPFAMIEQQKDANHCL